MSSSSSLRCVHAARVCITIMASTVRHHRSAQTLRATLVRCYQNRSSDGVRDAVRSLTTIGVQDCAYRKVLADLKVLDDRSSAGAISESDLTGTIGLTLQRLRNAAKIAKTKDLNTELDKFPKLEKEVPVTLTHDYYVLLAGEEPSPDEAAQYLPALAHQAQVPIEWLEHATGIKALYDITLTPDLDDRAGKNGAQNRR
jgi:hypothetical protein